MMPDFFPTTRGNGRYAASITLAGGVNYKSGPPGNCRLVRVNYTVSRTLDIVDDSDDLLL
jgi:hypothetical protein